MKGSVRILYNIGVALLLLLTMCVEAGARDKRFTLVIDAGHGGMDHGAVGAISKEKDLTLRYALAFGKMVERECPDVRVVYTRTKDVYLKLIERAEIANREKADLFLSFHINAVEGSRSVKGFQTYTLGRGQSTGNKGILENIDVAKRENSVIYMEKDYKQVYKGFDQDSPESDIMFEFIADKNRERSVDLARYMQQEVCRSTGRINGGAHQNNFAVLRLTSMPGCLLELGFISTREEEQFLNAPTSTDRYTQGIFRAFMQYKAQHADKIAASSGENIVVAAPDREVATPRDKKVATLRDKKVATPRVQPAPVQSVNAEQPVLDKIMGRRPAQQMVVSQQTVKSEGAKGNKQGQPTRLVGEKAQETVPVMQPEQVTVATQQRVPVMQPEQVTAATQQGVPVMQPEQGTATTQQRVSVMQPEQGTAATQQRLPVRQAEPVTTVQETEAPVFKIQIMASPGRMRTTGPAFKGLTPIDSYEEGEYVKYTYGASTDYNAIRQLYRTILNKFPGAFIIAFRGTEKMDVNKAIREFLKNKQTK